MFRFIHSSDWQIGKVYQYLPPDIAAVLQLARLEAITKIGRLARGHGASAVLVAGDVYDLEGPSDRTLLQPLERMRAFPEIAWHLLPGNHDPERPAGLWERLERFGVPENVRIHRIPGAADLGNGVYVLSAPLARKRSTADPSEVLDELTTPEDAVRIGLAHGSVVEFGSGGTTANLISRERIERGQLDYFALGDWHGFKVMSERVAYCGTPESDAFGLENAGKVVLVSVAGPGAVPEVVALQTGQYEWTCLEANLSNADDISALARRLAEASPDPSKTLVRLTASGTPSLADRMRFQDEIITRMGAALCHLEVDDSALISEATEDDLETIDKGGFVRLAIEKLREIIADPSSSHSAIARQALQRLYLEHHKHQSIV